MTAPPIFPQAAFPRDYPWKRLPGLSPAPWPPPGFTATLFSRRRDWPARALLPSRSRSPLPCQAPRKSPAAPTPRRQPPVWPTASWSNNTPTGYQAAGLPLGLSLDNASGLISGTPSLPGAYSVVIGASNAIGPGKNSKFTISVLQPSLSYTNTSFLLGVSSNSPGPVPTAGYSPASYRKPAGGNWDQVPGLDLDTANGRVTGAPTRAFAPVTLTVESLDALGVLASGVITVSSATAKPVLTSTNRVDGLTFSPITYNLTAAATNTTVLPGIFKLLRISNSVTTNWIIATNTTVLPGVTLNESTGALSGSPSQGGTFLAEFAADNSTAKSSEGYPG
ncbi:MAG: hypothetical protein EBT95_10325, partial [Verrucomicrobia bacterium]|nr:hypothetical protein [Verrucomicrobiota bacterium]